MKRGKSALPRARLLAGLRGVIEWSNGAASPAAPKVVCELGAELVRIGADSAGRKINHRWQVFSALCGGQVAVSVMSLLGCSARWRTGESGWSARGGRQAVYRRGDGPGGLDLGGGQSGHIVMIDFATTGGRETAREPCTRISRDQCRPAGRSPHAAPHSRPVRCAMPAIRGAAREEKEACLGA